MPEEQCTRTDPHAFHTWWAAQGNSTFEDDPTDKVEVFCPGVTGPSRS